MIARVVNGFEEKELLNSSRRLKVVIHICNHIAALPNLNKDAVLLPCESSTGHFILTPASKSVFIDSPALARRLSGL